MKDSDYADQIAPGCSSQHGCHFRGTLQRLYTPTDPLGGAGAGNRFYCFGHWNCAIFKFQASYFCMWRRKYKYILFSMNTCGDNETVTTRATICWHFGIATRYSPKFFVGDSKSHLPNIPWCSCVRFDPLPRSGHSACGWWTGRVDIHPMSKAVENRIRSFLIDLLILWNVLKRCV